jgi:hypothetical protein
MTVGAHERAEIENLYARYCHTVDALDGPGWAACFTPDGTFEVCTGVHRGLKLEGRAELAAHAADPEREPRARHWTSNLLLVQREGYVEGHCYGMRIDISGPRAAVASSVVYHDEIVQRDGRWLFRSRRPERDVENRPPEIQEGFDG